MHRYSTSTSNIISTLKHDYYMTQNTREYIGIGIHHLVIPGPTRVMWCGARPGDESRSQGVCGASKSVSENPKSSSMNSRSLASPIISTSGSSASMTGFQSICGSDRDGFVIVVIEVGVGRGLDTDGIAGLVVDEAIVDRAANLGTGGFVILAELDTVPVEVEVEVGLEGLMTREAGTGTVGLAVVNLACGGRVRPPTANAGAGTGTGFGIDSFADMILLNSGSSRSSSAERISFPVPSPSPWERRDG